MPPPTGPATVVRYALRGRIVTMDATLSVLDSGVIYVDGKRIRAVQPDGAPPPTGFEGVVPLETNGTIYPGLIELHNHLSYDALSLWDVPRRYTNRDRWAGTAEYVRLISGPMNVLGRTDGYPQAVARYAECKCLLGGVTTSQGIALFSDAGIAQFYRGVVRNVEHPDDPALPPAAGHIADVQAVDATAFHDRLRHSTCLLLHLSEGTDSKAHKHFEALRLTDDTWAIEPSLAGIHCVALTAADFATLHAHGASMIWSPLSNLLLYGATADVAAAKVAGVRIGIGADWSPSGSKSLFGELKVAHLVSAQQGGVFSDAELVAMATRNAAAILRWDAVVGSLEVEKRADLLVVDGTAGDPYTMLIGSPEIAISLVVVDGVPRYGQPRLMNVFGPGTEQWQVGGQQRVLNLAQSDPAVGTLTLGEAATRLQDGLHRLPELATALEQPHLMEVDPARPRWFLELDQPQPRDTVLRPYLGRGMVQLQADRITAAAATAKPLSAVLKPLPLDPLTVADDAMFLDRIAQVRNLSDDIKQGLAGLF